MCTSSSERVIFVSHSVLRSVSGYFFLSADSAVHVRLTFLQAWLALRDLSVCYERMSEINSYICIMVMNIRS